MKILLLSPASVRPPRHGVGVRLDRLARQLAERHEVTLVTFDWKAGVGPSPPYDLVELGWAEPRRSLASRWLTRFGLLGQVAASPENLGVIGEILGRNDFDVAAGQYLSLATLLPAIRGVPIVWAADGIQSRLEHPSGRRHRNMLRHMQHWWRWRRLRTLEEWAWRRADVLVAVSREEGDELRSRMGRNAHIVVAPNGANCAEYETVTPSLGTPRGLFVGGTWPPNVDAVNWLAREILPEILRRRRDFRLDVAGRVGESRNLARDLPAEIRRLGWVDNLGTVFGECGVFIAPIRDGHGTRIKILEAMAAGLPVVSTRLGAQGLELRDGEELLFAEDPRAIAEATLLLVEDRDLAARVGAAGRRAVRERFDWPIVASRFEEALVWAQEAFRNQRAEGPGRGRSERWRSVATHPDGCREERR